MFPPKKDVKTILPAIKPEAMNNTRVN